MKWWLNGALVDPAGVSCAVNTYSLHYGFAVFEGIRTYDVDGVARAFKLDEHIARFYDSARMLGLAIRGCEPEGLARAVLETVASWDEKDLYVRPLLYLGNGVMGLRTAVPDHNLAVLVWPYGTDRGSARYREGISVQISRHRRSKEHALAKVSGNYLSAVVAANELEGTGFDEAVLLDEDGFLSEATAQNIFIVKGGRLATPRTTACLDGITRRTVIALASGAGMAVEERDILPAELLSADEAFLTSTASEVLPIARVQASTLASPRKDSVTRQLMALYQQRVVSSNPSVEFEHVA